MAQQDIEVEILKTGEVKVHIHGIKGQKCIEYAKLFEKIVGPEKDRELTSEYYEPESSVGIDVSMDGKGY